MASWREFESEEPALAAAVLAIYAPSKHKVLATLRADGSPRLSGTEVEFLDGEVWLGSMEGSRKGADLRRDPRLALHNAPIDADLTSGDARISGTAALVIDDAEVRRFLALYRSEPEQPVPDEFDLFRIDVRDVMRISMGDPADHLVIETWRPGHGVTRVERA